MLCPTYVAHKGCVHCAKCHDPNPRWIHATMLEHTLDNYHVKSVTIRTLPFSPAVVTPPFFHFNWWPQGQATPQTPQTPQNAPGFTSLGSAERLAELCLRTLIFSLQIFHLAFGCVAQIGRPSSQSTKENPVYHSQVSQCLISVFNPFGSQHQCLPFGTTFPGFWVFLFNIHTVTSFGATQTEGGTPFFPLSACGEGPLRTADRWTRLDDWFRTKLGSWMGAKRIGALWDSDLDFAREIKRRS